MRNKKRLVWFLLMIVAGLAVGLVYGWLVSPVEYVDTGAESLHPAYKADYVLMVAEIYQMDHDLPTAVQRLSLLGNLPAQRQVVDALLTARTTGFSQADLTLMEGLRQGLLELPPVTTGSPIPTVGGQP